MPSQGTCSQAGGTVTCGLGALANGVTATVTITVIPAERRHDHEHGDRRGGADRSRRAEQRRERADDRKPRCRPLGDEDRLARPGARRRHAHLHAHRTQQRAIGRDRRDAHRHSAGRRDLPVGHASQGTLLPGERHRHLQPRRPCERRLGDGVRSAVTPQSTGTITNTASVAGAQTDPVTPNNSASAQTTVNPVADLALTKTDSPDPVLVGRHADLHPDRPEQRARRRAPA